MWYPYRIETVQKEKENLIHKSRRQFLALGGASAALGRGYGTPLRRDLRLKVTNPNAPVMDLKIRGCEFPPNVLTVAGRCHVFMSGGLSYAYTVSPDTSLPPTERETIIRARRGQGLFKERVMQLEERCRITKVDNPSISSRATANRGGTPTTRSG
jgi:hypothetical protein